jgi:hypothetical protein
MNLCPLISFLDIHLFLGLDFAMSGKMSVAMAIPEFKWEMFII